MGETVVVMSKVSQEFWDENRDVVVEFVNMELDALWADFAGQHPEFIFGDRPPFETREHVQVFDPDTDEPIGEIVECFSSAHVEPAEVSANHE